MAKRIGTIVGLVALVLALGAAALLRPDRALRTGAGLAAHNLCDAVFTQGLNPEQTFAELVRPMSGPVGVTLPASP